MKTLCLALALISGWLIAIKLFTYEFYLADDPTAGVALRPVPSLTSRAELGRSAAFGPDRVLITDENAFLGQGLYRIFVRIGWIAFPLSTLLCVAGWSRVRRSHVW